MEMQNLCMLRDIYREIRNFEIKFQQVHGLSLNEGMLLCSLKSTKYSSSEIAESLGLTNSNASKVIKSVEEKGYVKRVMGKEDKRQMYFSITQEGVKKLSDIKCEGNVINSLLEGIMSKSTL